MPLKDDEVPFNLDVQFKEAIATEKEILERSVMSGACKDHSRYMWETGQYLGLKMAEAHFQTLIDNFNNR
jgi:hypothetical protein